MEITVIKCIYGNNSYQMVSSVTKVSPMCNQSVTKVSPMCHQSVTKVSPQTEDVHGRTKGQQKTSFL